MLAQPFFWPQTGFNGSRTFAYQGPAPAVEKRGATGIREFFSYPNPVVKTEAVDFKYGFSATATDVRLDIFTYTGYHVYSRSGLPGAFPAMNEHRVFLERFGPAVYRCRLEAKVGGKRYTRYWKMAVVK
jgi:hypothetical protein